MKPVDNIQQTVDIAAG